MFPIVYGGVWKGDLKGRGSFGFVEVVASV